MDIQDIKKWFKHKNVLFAANGDIVPRSPLLASISTYQDILDDNMICIPGKSYEQSSYQPMFGLRAFMVLLDEAIKRSYDYILYVDADCFIWSLENLMRQFEKFVDGEYIIGGVPDGGVFCHRNANRFCINPFLAFFNVKRIARHSRDGKLQIASIRSEDSIPEVDRISNDLVLQECRAWREAFQPSVPYMLTDNFLRSNRIEDAYTYKFQPLAEFYYTLFLGLHFPDEKFMWMHGRDYVCQADPLGLTSGLYLNQDMSSDENLICLHTWFSRCLINPECKDRILVPHDDIDQGLNHAKRIKDVIQLVKSHLA